MPILARALLLLVFLSGCALQQGAAFRPTPAEAKLVKLMSQRLAIANEVAWIKYSNQLPVRDAKREAEVLDRLTTMAGTSGLDPITVKNFFAAQIAASRAQQENDIRLWRAGAALPVCPPQSLRGDIRPKIDATDRALIAALARLGPPRATLASFAYGELRRDGFCRPAAHLAAAALR